jgi:probable F420-dependent oxidoreductase
VSSAALQEQAELARAQKGTAGGERPGGPRGERERALAAAIGQVGVWDAGLCSAPDAVIRPAAVELEQAGYGAVWLHEAGRDAFVAAAILLAGTRRLVVGTSIVSIWRHEPEQMANAARTLGEAFPGRFVLGIGPGHEGAQSWHGRGYGRPLGDLAEYLDSMDKARYYAARPDVPVPRVIAALGPRALELARQRSRGAIPYLVPVAYTSGARAVLGPEPVLAVHQAIVVGQPPERVRQVAREHVGRYLQARNYRSNLLRCGFTERDLQGTGSQRLVDALVAIGGPDEVAARVRAHLDAGADHVCVNPIGRRPGEVPVEWLRELAARMPPGPARHVQAGNVAGAGRTQ